MKYFLFLPIVITIAFALVLTPIFLTLVTAFDTCATSTKSSNNIQRLDVAASYSEVVSYNGATVYLSGQVPENTIGLNITEQTKDVLNVIDERLKSANSAKDRILTATIYLTHLQRDYSGMNEVWNAWIPFGTAPARTTVGVSALARSDWLLEITVTAARN